MTDYCPGCHLVVAPFARDRRVNRQGVFHASCLYRFVQVQQALRKAPLVRH